MQQFYRKDGFLISFQSLNGTILLELFFKKAKIKMNGKQFVQEDCKTSLFCNFLVRTVCFIILFCFVIVCFVIFLYELFPTHFAFYRPIVARNTTGK